jgi:hypothetical protein
VFLSSPKAPVVLIVDFIVVEVVDFDVRDVIRLAARENITRKLYQE